MESFDLYKTLQVDPQADPEIIRAAYRRLARMYHPDLTDDREAAQRMAAINRAWEVLGDPLERARYDRERASAPETTARPRHTPGPTPPWPAAEPLTWGPAAGRDPAGTDRLRDRGSPVDRPPETVSRDWSPGRSSYGGRYDERTMRAPDGEGAAGPPPGNPSGSVLNFGRYAGWSLGEIARRDADFLEWLDRMPIGRPYRDEIDGLLRRLGRRRSAATADAGRRGLFRRR